MVNVAQKYGFKISSYIHSHFVMGAQQSSGNESYETSLEDIVQESDSCCDIESEQASTWQVFNKARNFFANSTAKEEGEEMKFSEGDPANDINLVENMGQKCCSTITLTDKTERDVLKFQPNNSPSTKQVQPSNKKEQKNCSSGDAASRSKSSSAPKKEEQEIASHGRTKPDLPPSVKQHARVDSQGESGVIRRAKLAAQDQRRLDDIALREDSVRAAEQERKNKQNRNKNVHGTPMKSSPSKLSKPPAPEKISTKKPEGAPMNTGEAGAKKLHIPCDLPKNETSDQVKTNGQKTAPRDEVRLSGAVIHKRDSETVYVKKNQQNKNKANLPPSNQENQSSAAVNAYISNKQSDSEVQATPVKKTSSIVAEEKTLEDQKNPTSKSSIARYNYSRQYRKNMKITDYVFTKDRKLAHYWLIARFLTNKEFQLKMVKKYKQFVVRFPNHVLPGYSNLISNFLTHSLNHLPEDAVSLLLSKDHKYRRRLVLPHMLRDCRMLRNYIGECDVHKDLLEDMDDYYQKRGSKKRKRRRNLDEDNDSAIACIKIKTNEDQLPEPFKLSRWWKSCNVDLHSDYVVDIRYLVGEIVKESTGMLSDILRFQPTKLITENDMNEMIMKHLSSSRRDDTKQGNIRDKNSENSNTIAHECQLSLASCGLADDKDCGEEAGCSDELNFRIYKYDINNKQNSAAFQTRTNLRSVFESKPLKCPVQRLTTWPWNFDCKGAVSQVRCLIRINTQIKKCHKTIQGQNAKKNRGKRNKKCKTKKQQPGVANETNKNGVTVGENIDDGIRKEACECRNSACKEFYEDMETNHVVTCCKAIVIFPFYAEKDLSSMVFYRDSNCDYESKENSIERMLKRKAPTILQNILPQLSTATGCRFNQDEQWVSAPQKPLSVITSSGHYHHHNNLIIDFLIPTYNDVNKAAVISHDVTLLLNGLVKYVCDLHSYRFGGVDEELYSECVEYHIYHTQLMCECIFDFIVFSETCGPVELRMRGISYVSLGQKHYRKAHDLAIEAGVLPLFVSFLGEHVSKLPWNLKIVHDSSVYSDVLDFIDPGETYNENLPTRFNYDESRIDPIAVSMLETVLGKGYANTVDDDEVFQTLMRSKNKKADLNHEPDGGLAVISPIYKPHYAAGSRWRQRGLHDVEFTHAQFIQKFPLYKDSNKGNTYKDILKTLETYTGKNKEVTSVNSVTDESTVQKTKDGEKVMQNSVEQKSEVTSVWDTLHGVIEGIQERFILGKQKINRNARELRPLRECEVTKEEQIKLFTDEAELKDENRKTEPRKGDTAAHKREQVASSKETTTSPDNGNAKTHHQVTVVNASSNSKVSRAQEKVDSAVKNETRALTQPQQGNQPREESAERQNAEGEEVSKQAQSKKKNREYLSSSQRQQRQIQRLREKWEKKHKSVGGKTEPAQEEKS